MSPLFERYCCCVSRGKIPYIKAQSIIVTFLDVFESFAVSVMSEGFGQQSQSFLQPTLPLRHSRWDSGADALDVLNKVIKATGPFHRQRLIDCEGRQFANCVYILRQARREKLNCLVVRRIVEEAFFLSFLTYN